MRSLDVNFSLIAPNEGWCFIRKVPRSNTSHINRIYPDVEMIDPFLAAFAKAVLNMLKLESFTLLSDIQNEEAPFHISYNEPGPKTDELKGREEVQLRRSRGGVSS
ncbi:hypothetical protein IQ06DRAFT_47523 [Phaeosphaeriaceae sp. SRC1lsM3a]|nr:hypothetical protein IQ06DRAFT_47523 [Stagonospora sp. SRC1lsM3a]